MTEPRNRFGPRLRTLRESARLSLAALSERTGLSKTWLHRLESRTGDMTTTPLYRLCEALGVRPHALLDHCPGVKGTNICTLPAGHDGDNHEDQRSGMRWAKETT